MCADVVVTGLGFISSIGNDKAAVSDRLRTLTSGLQAVDFLDNPDLPVKSVGMPRGFEVDSGNWRHWKVPAEYEIDRSLIRSLSPQGMYAMCAVMQALKDASLDFDDLKDGETGLYCASVGSPIQMYGNLATMYASKGQRGNPLGVLASIAGTLNFNLGSWLGIRGSNCGYVSACASGSHALGGAWDDITLGRQKRVIVVGAEDATAESLLPFHSMRALSTNPDPVLASRPFDRDRDGFVGAGGATVVILEEAGFARERGARIYAEMAGWGQASDGYHRAAPEPEGRGLATAMRQALSVAGVSVEEIDYICAHATSTPAGDLAEAAAIRSVFGEPLVGTVPVSSPKALAGHSLSMAGVLDFAVCCLMLDEGFILGNANLVNVEPGCEHLCLPRETSLNQPTIILNNSSGFGGSNVCNVLKQYQAI